jgi:uncharacterized protein YcbX
MISQATKVGTIAALHRYPVKSMMGEELNASAIGAKGLLGDRAYALVDTSTGKILSAKNPSKWPNLFSYRAVFVYPPVEAETVPPVRIGLPDGRFVLSTDANVDEVLSASFGKAVKLTSSAPAAGSLEQYWPEVEGIDKKDETTEEPIPSNTFFDLSTIHLITTSTINALRRDYPEGRIEPRRFRPNIIIETEEEGYTENQWVDKVIAIGEQVRLKVTGRCSRCIMTTLAQGDLPRDLGVLKALAKFNGATFGINTAVLQPGMIRRGDVITIED